ncbi:MAG: hypothetical protein DRH08_07845 [Deltaproteobacteria bacterium]|nr:MAG: hypothetical protein DRH08_07845 [Deltaproteobacteria bacterium]
MTTKPEQINRVWAETGVKTDPGATKYNDGWGVEIPTHGDMNYILQGASQAAKYNNEQGINTWDTETTYPIDAITKGSDGILYQAIVSNTDADPISSPAEWVAFTITLAAFVALSDRVAALEA